MDTTEAQQPGQPVHTMYRQEEYTNPETRATMFSIFSLVTHTAAAIMAAIFIVILAILMPWNGGMITTSFEISFALAVLGSSYALGHGYMQIKRRGLTKLGMFFWGLAIAVSVLLAIDIILLGFALHGTVITFYGSSILSAPDMFFMLIVYQGIYFLSQAILASATARSERNMRDWYTAIFFLILSINTASIIFGPIIMSYF